MSNRFLSTPAAHRSDQNWTHLPKIGEVCFLGKPNFVLSFSWRKIALPVDSGKFRSPLPQEVFLKNRKNRRGYQNWIFSSDLRCALFCAYLPAQPFAQFCVIASLFCSFYRKFHTCVEKVKLSRFPKMRSETYLLFLSDRVYRSPPGYDFNSHPYPVSCFTT